VEASDKLKIVAGFHLSPTPESPDKLKFVGHFRRAGVNKARIYLTIQPSCGI